MATKSVSFYFTGGLQSWQVPAVLASTTVTVSLGGASGGGTPGRYGQGGVVIGTLTVTAGETLGVIVGGVGGTPRGTTPGAGGWPNGGAGGKAAASGAACGYGGGGASEIRRGATRLAVAAGGGAEGRNGYGTGASGLGGAGGAATGANGTNGGGTGPANGVGGGGGTAAAGGSAGTSGSTAGSTTGQGGAGGYSNGTNTRGGGGAGGGWTGGGGGGASSPNRGSGGGGGGANYTGGLASTTTNQRSGNIDSGYITFTYQTPPLRPSIAPPGTNYTGGVFANMPIAVKWTDSDSPAATISTSDLRYRVQGATPWTTITGITPMTSVAGLYVFAANTLTANVYELQVRITDSAANVGPWSDSLFFTVNGAPAAAFPYANLPNQWPTPATDADAMRQRIDVPLNRLAQRIAHPTDTDPGDPTRQASLGAELYWSNVKGGASEAVAVAANTPFSFDRTSYEGDGYQIVDYKSGLITVPLGGLWLVGAVAVCTAATVNQTVVFVNGLPAIYAKPSARARNIAGHMAVITPFLARMAGGEQVSLQADRASTFATDLNSDSVTTIEQGTRLYMWRIGP